MMRSLTTPAPFLRLLGWLSFLGTPIMGTPIDYKSRMDSALDEVFGNNTSARVTLVRHFDAGDFMLPTRDQEGLPILHIPRAENGVTLVKFFIRTNGSAAPGEPSPNSGTDVGFEIWFPDDAQWNGRIYNHVVGGFQGDPAVTSPEYSASETWKGRYTAELASESGYVSGVTNGGQSNPKGIQDLQWLLNDDGSWNMEGWKNANWQATHLLSVNSKAISKAFYGKPAHHAYVFGCSTGGRAVYKAFQKFPNDYDGFLSFCPSITQSRLFPSLGHPFIVMNNHLGNLSAFTDIQAEIIAQKALQYGDSQITGKHDGYFSTFENNYDATKDLSLLSVEEGGYCTDEWAFSMSQLEAINMIWYGPTLNGTIPDPVIDSGALPELKDGRVWYGKQRGVSLAFILGGRDIVGNYLAVIFKDPSLAPPDWTHPLGNSSDAWMHWSYEKFAESMLEAQRIDREYFQMDSDDSDLRAPQKAGVKIITQHAFADPAVAPQSAIHYRERAAKYVGGHDKLEEFSRLFLVPGQDHCIRGPGVAGSANPPMPTVEEWLDVLVEWVENGRAPEQVIGHSVDNSVSRPICLYPKIAKYDGSGDVNTASSYSCEGEMYQ